MSEEEQQGEERRASERRWVMIRVLVDDKISVQFGQTVNVSETGILIERVPETELQVGQRIDVIIEGILDENASGQGRTMSVVRVEEERVALRFED